jgi:hypothetical protein
LTRVDRMSYRYGYGYGHDYNLYSAGSDHWQR